MQLSHEGLTAEAYTALPEEVCERIEVVDGAVVVLPAPRRPHQRLVRHLADAIEALSRPGLSVATHVDLRIRDTPLLNRRPDIVVYDANTPDDQPLRPADCLLVVEVTTTESATADHVTKPSEFAAAGIKHYWRVEHTHDSRRRAVRHAFTATVDTTYTVVGIDDHVLVTDKPFALSIELDSL
ncbi:Uma2 family endonuclease [Amycolatopsis sp. CM201R]|nr:Uma2 family endonuclease [Amycolatopsis sp. 505]MDS0149274.1 Uma2 family endonuclease [Amycolatopsis sp. CM201R]